MSTPDELRPHDTVRSQLRLPAALHERLNQACGTSGRSMNGEIVQRLQESFGEGLQVDLPPELISALEQEAERYKTTIGTVIKWMIERDIERDKRAVVNRTSSIAIAAQKRAEQLSLMDTIKAEIQRIKDSKSPADDSDLEEKSVREIQVLQEILGAIEVEAKRTARQLLMYLKAYRREAFQEDLQQ